MNKDIYGLTVQDNEVNIYLASLAGQEVLFYFVLFFLLEYIGEKIRGCSFGSDNRILKIKLGPIADGEVFELWNNVLLICILAKWYWVEDSLEEWKSGRYGETTWDYYNGLCWVKV